MSHQPSPLYKQYTQYKYWLFTPEKLKQLRTKQYQNAISRVLENWKKEWVRRNGDGRVYLFILFSRHYLEINQMILN
jgi:hypothetical protein